MATHKIPEYELENVKVAYEQCVAEGFIGVGVVCGSGGRRSAIHEVARRTGFSLKQVQYRLGAVGIGPLAGTGGSEYQPLDWTYPREHHLTLRNATVMCAGDLHMWPLARVPLSPIKAAFRAVAQELMPDAIVINGDIIDGTRISKHLALRGQNPPRVVDEVQAASDYLLSLPETVQRVITMSNHDVRIDNYLGNQAPELADMSPRLIDRLPGWTMAYAAVINDETEIRHETGSGGIHVRHNNATRMGRTIVTGHTHQLGVSPVYTRNGVHYGIECGMLSHPFEPQFEYTWNRPTRWQPGFVVLTFDANGLLMPPELCEWTPRGAVFRGRVVEAEARYRVRAGSAAA